MIKRNLFIGFLCLLMLFVVGEVCAQGYEFGSNVRVSDYPSGTANCSTPNAGQRGVAVRGDTVYCVWSDDRAGRSNWFAKSIDGGETFLANVRVDDGVGDAFLPTLAVGDDGTIYVAWTDERPGYSYKQIYFSKSTDGGLTFTPDVVVNDSINEPGPQGSPSMCADDSGVVYAVWQEGPATHPDIYFTLSTDNGDSAFVEPNVKVSDVPPDSGMFRPSIAVGDSGIVYVMWSDYRNNYWYDDVYFAAGKFDNGIVEEDPKLETGNLRIRIYPNPFRNKVEIQFSIGQSAKSIELKVYDISGRLVSNLVTGDMCSGALIWDGKDKRGISVPAGVYYIKGVIGKQKVNEKVVYVK